MWKIFKGSGYFFQGTVFQNPPCHPFVPAFLYCKDGYPMEVVTFSSHQLGVTLLTYLVKDCTSKIHSLSVFVQDKNI